MFKGFRIKQNRFSVQICDDWKQANIFFVGFNQMFDISSFLLPISFYMYEII